MSNSEKREDPNRMSPEMRERLRKLTQGRVRRALFTMAIKAMAKREGAADELKNPAWRNGLLTGAILANELVYPDAETNELARKYAPAGRWIAHDFFREQTFGKKAVEQTGNDPKGRLVTFLLPPYADNDKDILTPLDTLRLDDINHLVNIYFPTIEEAVETGYIQESTYADAYSAVGRTEYLEDLGKLGLLDAQVFAVTPKGNGLTILLPDGGDHAKTPKLKQTAVVFDPLLGLNPA